MLIRVQFCDFFSKTKQIYLDTITACCEEIILRSTKYKPEQLKSLGKYILKPTEVVENHSVYKHELNDEHIAFSSDYGWTVR